jgi:hypothetical protein
MSGTLGGSEDQNPMVYVEASGALVASLLVSYSAVRITLTAFFYLVKRPGIVDS